MSSNPNRKPGFKIDDILKHKPNESASVPCIYPRNSEVPYVPPERSIHQTSDSVALAPCLHSHSSLDHIFPHAMPNNVHLFQHIQELQKSCKFFYPHLSSVNQTSYFEQAGSDTSRGLSLLPLLYSHPYSGCYMSLTSSKRKGGQIRFTPQQTRSLENRFAGAKYLSPEDRRHLAAELKLSDRQVKTWFQNRRAKFRRSSNNITKLENREPELNLPMDVRKTTNFFLKPANTQPLNDFHDADDPS